MAGVTKNSKHEILRFAEDDFIKKLKIPEGFAYFLPIKIRCNANAQMEATPVAIGGSGDYAALARADGFVQLNPDVQNLIVPFYSWKV